MTFVQEECTVFGRAPRYQQSSEYSLWHLGTLRHRRLRHHMHRMKYSEVFK